MQLHGDGNLAGQGHGFVFLSGQGRHRDAESGELQTQRRGGDTGLGGALTVTKATTLQDTLTVANGKNNPQIVFAYNENTTNPAGYGHVIKTRHYGGADNPRANAIDFYVWQRGIPP